MKDRSGGEKSFLFLALVWFLLVSAGCSMQMSGSKAEPVRPDKLASSNVTPLKQENPQDKIPVKVDYLTPVCNIREPEIFVYKEKRRLYVVQSNVLVRDYPIGLGFRPLGDKEKQGDGRTPEGEFRICMKNAASRFIKSLGLNYPDKRHAERAFFSGMITPLQFRDILLAVEKKTTPPWNTVLGGEIFIHAGGAHKDWTEGCVALYNSDMEELFQLTSVGTPVTIRP
jgi:hypothetical protein